MQFLVFLPQVLVHSFFIKGAPLISDSPLCSYLSGQERKMMAWRRTFLLLLVWSFLILIIEKPAFRLAIVFWMSKHGGISSSLISGMLLPSSHISIHSVVVDLNNRIALKYHWVQLFHSNSVFLSKTVFRCLKRKQRVAWGLVRWKSAGVLEVLGQATLICSSVMAY